MELKDYKEKYGEKAVIKVLTKLEKQNDHVCTSEFKRMLENEIKTKHCLSPNFEKLCKKHLKKEK